MNNKVISLTTTPTGGVESKGFVFTGETDNQLLVGVSAEKKSGPFAKLSGSNAVVTARSIKWGSPSYFDGYDLFVNTGKYKDVALLGAIKDHDDIKSPQIARFKEVKMIRCSLIDQSRKSFLKDLQFSNPMFHLSKIYMYLYGVCSIGIEATYAILDPSSLNEGLSFLKHLDLELFIASTAIYQYYKQNALSLYRKFSTHPDAKMTFMSKPLRQYTNYINKRANELVQKTDFKKESDGTYSMTTHNKDGFFKLVIDPSNINNTTISFFKNGYSGPFDEVLFGSKEFGDNFKKLSFVINSRSTQADTGLSEGANNRFPLLSFIERQNSVFTALTRLGIQP